MTSNTKLIVDIRKHLNKGVKDLDHSTANDEKKIIDTQDIIKLEHGVMKLINLMGYQISNVSQFFEIIALQEKLNALLSHNLSEEDKKEQISIIINRYKPTLQYQDVYKYVNLQNLQSKLSYQDIANFWQNGDINFRKRSNSITTQNIVITSPADEPNPKLNSALQAKTNKAQANSILNLVTKPQTNNIDEDLISKVSSGFVSSLNPKSAIGSMLVLSLIVLAILLGIILHAKSRQIKTLEAKLKQIKEAEL